MSEDLKDWQKEAIKRAEEYKNDTFESWIVDLEAWIVNLNNCRII